MQSTTKELRLYQVRLVTDVCRATGDVLVEQPTGSGKTVEIVALIAMNLGQRFSHALIAAPQEQIEQGFTKRDYDTVAFPASPGVAVVSIQVPNKPPHSLIKGARDSGLGSVKRVVQYLRQPGPLDHAFACTHAALNRLTGADLPEDLSGKALFIDEAHHVSADGLSQTVAIWRERGGQVFFFTATPYRGDGRPVKLEGMRSFRRSLAEHMAEGFAPRHLESGIVALGQPGDAITPGQFTGEEAPPSSYFDELIAALVRRWLEDRKPKAIVRVPPMQGGRSGELVSRLIQAFQSRGARVLDATGTGAADKQRFLTALAAEKDRTYATSGFEVMVGIQRVLEGTDWPVCSAVYCVGMPGSLNTVVQFLGRAMRLKGEDYPDDQRDRARLVFFVPCGGGAALADLSLDHSRHALLTCCFLADHEVGQEWIVLREIRRGIEVALGSRTENPAAADAENQADEPLEPEIRAQVELVMTTAREQIINDGGEPTVGEVVKFAAKTRPDLPEPALRRVATEILAVQPTAGGTSVREAIQQAIATRLRIDPMVKKAMAEAFAVVLEEFRDVTLSDSAVLESIGRQVHEVTGGLMREFAQRLRYAAPRPLTVEQILTWADAHHTRTGDWPGIDSGQLTDEPCESWQNLNAALSIGLRGLPGGSSLAKLLNENRNVRNMTRPPGLTVEQILRWADAHYDRSGKWPKRQSGTVMEAPDETWSGIDNSLSNGLRGLLGGSSLPKLLAECRGVRNSGNLRELTIGEILSWVDEHHKLTNSWPDGDSGPVHNVPGETGETWKGIEMALLKGHRGLPGHSSISKLLAEHHGVRNQKMLPALSVEQILAWADSHHHHTKMWPNENSGIVIDAPGERWSGINAALNQGTRGLPGESSLPQLLAARRGVPNRMSLPKLGIEQILTWADNHYKQTGKWPDRNSGSVLGNAEETWKKIDWNLRDGSRGLQGGSSLAQLLNERRGVRNPASPPKLTIEQILVWADAHFKYYDQWPRTGSGNVLGSIGEKWANINAALQQGLRGLQGGMTLAKLLADFRKVAGLNDFVKQ